VRRAQSSQPEADEGELLLTDQRPGTEPGSSTRARSPESRRKNGSAFDRARSMWGTRPGRLGVFIVIWGALLGLIVSLAAGAAPGWLLGGFVIFAAVIGALVVRPRTAYLVIPVPAPAYLIAGVIVGLVHDRANDTTHAILAASAVQWIASGFVPMIVATGLAIIITAVRYVNDRRDLFDGRRFGHRARRG
jgi:hypothetical protein